jgi:hypothetical protein
MQDLTLLGHVAFLRHYAVQLHALASASPAVGARLRQIAYCLDADANQLEEVVTGEGSSEEQEQAFYGVSAPPGDDRRGCNASKSDGAFADCLDAIRQGVDAALHWPHPQSD